ncbi:MAG: DUF393 domain-containing protein [Bacteroidia bacterium]|nr:DUF393 domain-containing protein [Bacteroidia bacterium]MDW8133449.1 DUF393 domain-containing protein [Bacteroidia bacterium]
MSERKLYYDRNCPICSSLASWIEKDAHRAGLQLVPTEYDNLEPLPLPVDSVIYDQEGKLWIKSEAIRHILKDIGWVIPAKIVGLIPLRWRDKMYDILAALRKWLFLWRP